MNNVFRIALSFVILIGIVVGLSYLSGVLWSSGVEKKAEVPSDAISLTDDMTVGQVAQKYDLEGQALKQAFGLKDKSDLQKSFLELGITSDEATIKLNKALAFSAEESSKNWVKILVKFLLWFAFLGVVFSQIRQGKVNASLRKKLYFIAILLFGVLLGSDPSPMGTVKDAIVLWGTYKIVFPPRMIALVVFILLVILANKFICSWGCQIGTLQDLIFRLNRNEKETAGLIRQYKLPFVLTNTIRFLTLIALTIAAFVFATDIIHPIDPFVIYSPMKLGVAGIVFIGIIVIASLFVYRPWCTLFCPFGFVGWLFERFSLNKIIVNYDTCVACKACSKACPSVIMDAILVQDKTIPDCFSCGTCIETCPTRSISFKTGKRVKPPDGKFK